MSNTLQKLIEKHSIPVPFCGCWLWTGGIGSAGYGTVAVNRRASAAHRVSWMANHGPIQDGLFVCHSCDIPLCVNPDHLFLGTQAENMADMTAKGRRKSVCGTDRSNARLTDDAVKEIRLRGDTRVALAKKFGVSPSAISEIWRGKNWKHVA